MQRALLTEYVVVKEVEVEMEVVVIQYSKNLPSLEPSIAGAEAACSLCEGSSSTGAASLRDRLPSMLIALLFLPEHVVTVLDDT